MDNDIFGDYCNNIQNYINKWLLIYVIINSKIIDHSSNTQIIISISTHIDLFYLFIKIFSFLNKILYLYLNLNYFL